jgi:hypothetical protein
MGKIGRIACIATPMVLTAASFLCIVIVFLAGTNRKDANLRDLYFFKVCNLFLSNASQWTCKLTRAP